MTVMCSNCARKFVEAVNDGNPNPASVLKSRDKGVARLSCEHESPIFFDVRFDLELLQFDAFKHSWLM